MGIIRLDSGNEYQITYNYLTGKYGPVLIGPGIFFRPFLNPIECARISAIPQGRSLEGCFCSSAGLSGQWALKFLCLVPTPEDAKRFYLSCGAQQRLVDGELSSLATRELLKIENRGKKHQVNANQTMREKLPHIYEKYGVRIDNLMLFINFNSNSERILRISEEAEERMERKMEGRLARLPFPPTEEIKRYYDKKVKRTRQRFWEGK